MLNRNEMIPSKPDGIVVKKKAEKTSKTQLCATVVEGTFNAFVSLVLDRTYNKILKQC